MDELFEVQSKNDVLKKLRLYATSPDDHNIHLKEIVKNNLLKCPELLFALNNKKLESELFDSKGNLNPDGQWDLYFGANSNIRPFIFIPETQASVNNFVCYTVSFNNLVEQNKIQQYTKLTFVIYVNGQDAFDKNTGIYRHDLISSVLRERFNWSQIFGTQCDLISNGESVTDNNYIVREMSYQIVLLNSIVKTNFNTNQIHVINKTVRQ